MNAENTQEFIRPQRWLDMLIATEKGWNRPRLAEGVWQQESYTHGQEIEKFKEIAKADDIKFSALSYQKLITKLAKDYYDGNEEYVHYISDRYL